MNRLTVYTQIKQGAISRFIFGQFAEHLGRCIYEGFWVGEDSAMPNTRGIRDDVVAALKRIRIPVLRWPGGCFADEYHWKDGIGPCEGRKRMVNTHWGGVVENNRFGTHEFMDLCSMLGCEPYISGNLGSGTVQEMSEWIEYMTFDGESPMASLRRSNGRSAPWPLKYFGVGNESWGCGGNMKPEFYADQYKRYQTYCRNYGGNKLYKIACGPNDEYYHWTEVLMREAASHMNGLSFHYYTVSGDSWERKGSATEFNEQEWFDTLRNAIKIDAMIKRHSAIMDVYDPQGRVGLIVDEWGAWHRVEPGTNPGFLYQQNAMRDAMVAGITLNILMSHCRRVQMANIAQVVNVLQAMILTEGAKMVLTPTYHVFDLFTVHQDAELLKTSLDSDAYALGAKALPAISAQASQDAGGNINVTLCNLDPGKSADVVLELASFRPGLVTGMVVTGKSMTSHNTFENPREIAVEEMGRGSLKILDTGVTATLPPMSVVRITIMGQAAN